MTYETEGAQMAQELNEALDIEPNASHTQRLFTILRLRTQAIKTEELRLDLTKAQEDRDQAQQMVAELLDAQTDFISSTLSHAHRVRGLAENLARGVANSLTEAEIDAFDAALAELRQSRDNGERHNLDEVAKEAGVDLDTEVDLLDVDGDDTPVDPDPLGMVDFERKPEVQMDFPGPQDEKIGAATTTDFVDERNRTPFHDASVPLANDTRDWLVSMAEGGARDDG